MINKSHIFGNLLGLLLFSFLMTVASLSTFAQQTIKISGRVTDFNDKPISNCTVMLMDGCFNAIDSVVTDSVGFYLMNGIKPGKYMALTAIKWDEYVRFSKLPEHGITVDVKPEHLMEKVLYATDELTGLIWAAALMRPSKSVQDMELKSLKKKYKSKGFAAGCSREVIEQGAEMLGWPLDEVLQKTLDAMRDCETRVASEMEKI